MTRYNLVFPVSRKYSADFCVSRSSYKKTVTRPGDFTRYPLDAYSWTENYALEHGRSPEEILLEREERAAHLRLLAALPEALAHATPTQARRVRAYYIAGISQPEISRREGVDSSKVSVAIRRGLRNMRRCYDGLFPAE